MSAGFWVLLQRNETGASVKASRKTSLYTDFVLFITFYFIVVFSVEVEKFILFEVVFLLLPASLLSYQVK